MHVLLFCFSAPTKGLRPGAPWIPHFRRGGWGLVNWISFSQCPRGEGRYQAGIPTYLAPFIALLFPHPARAVSSRLIKARPGPGLPADPNHNCDWSPSIISVSDRGNWPFYLASCRKEYGWSNRIAPRNSHEKPLVQIPCSALYFAVINEGFLIFMLRNKERKKERKKELLHCRGIEPGPRAWESRMLTITPRPIPFYGA